MGQSSIEMSVVVSSWTAFEHFQTYVKLASLQFSFIF
jgi:hypothetical protein